MSTFSVLCRDGECVLWSGALHAVRLHCDHSRVPVHSEQIPGSLRHLAHQPIKYTHVISFRIVVVSCLDCENLCTCEQKIKPLPIPDLILYLNSIYIVCAYVCLTFSCKLLDHSVVLHLWESWPIVIGVPHHHSKLHGLSNLSAIWPLYHYVNMKLKGEKGFLWSLIWK